MLESYHSEKALSLHYTKNCIMLPVAVRKHNKRRMRKIMCYSSKFKENGGVVKITLPYVHIFMHALHIIIWEPLAIFR